METIARDLVAYEVINNEEISRQGLRRLFKYYSKDITKSYFSNWCGTGAPRVFDSINLLENRYTLEKSDQVYLNCRFSINALLNDSVIKEINFYDEAGNFIGKAKFKAISDEEYSYLIYTNEVYTEVFSRVLLYEFVSALQEEEEIKIYDKPYLIYNNTDEYEDLYNITYLDDSDLVKNNPNFIGCIFHPRVLGQISQMGVQLQYLYYY